MKWNGVTYRTVTLSLSGGQTVRLGLSAAPGSLPVGCIAGIVVCESHSVWKEGSGSSMCQKGESFTEWILQENMVWDFSTPPHGEAWRWKCMKNMVVMFIWNNPLHQHQECSTPPTPGVFIMLVKKTIFHSTNIRSVRSYFPASHLWGEEQRTLWLKKTEPFLRAYCQFYRCFLTNWDT